MNPNQVIDDASKKFSVAFEHFQNELKKLRTGRAHPSMLDSVMIEAYGTQMPLNQAATITTPEAQLIQISPFDPNNLQLIVSAIRDNPSLGMNPSDDGRIVRVPVPALNEERRKEIVKQLGARQEDAMITLRSIRHDALDTVEKAKKEKTIGEDDAKRLEKQIDESMNHTRSNIESASKAKEQEIMTV